MSEDESTEFQMEVALRKELQSNLTRATAALELCERPVKHLAASLSCHCFTGVSQVHKDWCEIKYAQQALAAIKEVKTK